MIKIQKSVLSNFLRKGAIILEKQVLLDFKKEGLFILSSSDEEIGFSAFLPNKYFSNYEICKGVIPDLKFLYSLIKGFSAEDIELSLKDETIMFINADEIEVEVPLVLEKYFKPLKVSSEPFQSEEVQVVLLKSILKPLKLTKDEEVEFKVVNGEILYATAGKLEKIKVKLNLAKRIDIPFDFSISLNDLFKVLNLLENEVVLFEFYERFLKINDFVLEGIEYTYYLKMKAKKNFASETKEFKVSVKEELSLDVNKTMTEKELKEEKEKEEAEEFIELFRKENKKEEKKEEKLDEEEDIW
jgi:hypothetical protein